VLCANTRALVPGCVINCRPIGVLIMEDEGGSDEKIIAVPSSKLTKRYDKILSFRDLPAITTEQIEHFFAHYKDLEPGKWVKIVEWGDEQVAKRLIREAIERGRAHPTASP
jgi:inorganic pyrophosphatase